MSSLNSKITELHEKIGQFEDTDPNYLSDDLKKVRNSVFFTHTLLENSLETMLLQNLTNGFEKLPNHLKARVLETSFSLLDEITFSKKATIAKDLNLIPIALFNKIMKVNSSRVVFAHPLKYAKEISKLEDADRQLKILESLWGTINELNNHLYPRTPKPEIDL